MRLWNLLCIAALAVSAPAGGQLSAQEMIETLELYTKDFAQLATMTNAVASKTGTPEELEEFAKEFARVEHKDHESRQPTREYAKDEQKKICTLYKEHAAAGMDYVNSLKTNAGAFNKEQHEFFVSDLEFINREIEWFTKTVAPKALPDCQKDVETDTEHLKTATDAAIKVMSPHDK